MPEEIYASLEAIRAVIVIYSDVPLKLHWQVILLKNVRHKQAAPIHIFYSREDSKR